MADERDLSMLETLDHLLDRGVVITGEATISVADVDLLYLGLSVVLGNVDAVDRLRLPPSLKKSSEDEP